MRQLVTPRGWGTRLRVWTRHAPPAQTPPLAREIPGVEMSSSYWCCWEAPDEEVCGGTHQRRRFKQQHTLPRG
jgi:hypothetical protein